MFYEPAQAGGDLCRLPGQDEKLSGGQHEGYSEHRFQPPTAAPRLPVLSEAKVKGR